MRTTVAIYSHGLIGNCGSIGLRLGGPFGRRQKFQLNSLLCNAPDARDFLPILFEEALLRQGLYFMPRSLTQKLGAHNVLLISAYNFSSVEKEYETWLKGGKPKIEPDEAKVKPEMTERLWATSSNANCLDDLLQGVMVRFWEVEDNVLR